MAETKSKLFNDTPYVPYLAHETQNKAALDIGKSDIELLRALAQEVATIANLPSMDERKRRWTDINDLKGGRPVIWLNEVCWHEMNVDDELTIKCENEVARRIETELRKTIYQWRHMAGDMVVENVFYSPYIIENTGFGITEVADVLETNKDSSIASRHFHNQIFDIEDVDKIKDPIIAVDKESTENFYHSYKQIFEGIMPVEKRGATGFWFAPWDDIVLFMGAENLLLNLLTEPELMHALIMRLMAAYQSALDQWVNLGISASNNTNVRIGSGGYGYTSQLPKAVDNAPLKDTWGSSTAQIFGSVSGIMHKEYGIDYEIEWLKRFGLNYYGCCEPLHKKLDILEAIPNLRKISISPWADEAVAAEGMKGRYALSLKPSPSCLAYDNFDESLVKQELETKLTHVKDCSTEVILKDISTVRNKPERLWRWTEIAMEIARKYE